MNETLLYEEWIKTQYSNLVKIAEGVGVYLQTDTVNGYGSLIVSFIDNDAYLDIPKELRSEFSSNYKKFIDWLVKEININEVLFLAKLYPLDDQFLSSITKEIETNIVDHYKKTNKLLGDHFLDHFRVPITEREWLRSSSSKVNKVTEKSDRVVSNFH